MILVADDKPSTGVPREQRIPENNKRVVIFPGVSIRQVAQILELSGNKTAITDSGARR